MNHPPVGAFRIFPKSEFQCTGRPNGYYADIESGCQVYHMCDGMGRQFSYACPNTTLFQQRMLICDHWYMVNCSKAPGDYDANLLIGQKDKPFVSEHEHEQRTPRPDLLDRPYAADYAGESFRNQFKDTPSFQNALLTSNDYKKQSPNKIQFQDQQHYSNEEFTDFHRPSTILVTTLEPFIRTTTKPNRNYNNNVRRNNNDEGNFIEPLFNRRNDNGDMLINVHGSDRDLINYGQSPISESNNGFNIDLGVSSSQDSKRTVDEVKFDGNIKRNLQNTLNKTVETPSQLFSTPLEYPIFSEEKQTEQDNVRNYFLVSTANNLIDTDTPRPLVQRTLKQHQTNAQRINADKQHISANNLNSDDISNVENNIKLSQPRNKQLVKQKSKINLKNSRILNRPSQQKQPEQSFQVDQLQVQNQPPQQQVQLLQINGNTLNNINYPKPSGFTLSNNNAAGSNFPIPSEELLPPYDKIVVYSDATTQGPPIYFEWKIPANGLELPKLGDDKDINENPSLELSKHLPLPESEFLQFRNTYTDIDLQKENDESKTISNVNDTRQQSIHQFRNNPFLFTIFKSPSVKLATDVTNNISKVQTENDDHSNKTPIQRSISNLEKSIELLRAASDIKQSLTDFSSLKKTHSIPDYTFPLESGIRTGYDADITGAVNSFQVKIPETIDKNWYGENADCPQCHPAFLKRGTCQPCIKLS